MPLLVLLPFVMLLIRYVLMLLLLLLLLLLCLFCFAIVVIGDGDVIAAGDVYIVIDCVNIAFTWG